MNDSLLDGAAGTAIGAGLTGFFTWLYQLRREKKDLLKSQTEIDANEIDNVEKAVAIWRKLAEEMNAQVVELRAQIRNLSDEVDTLRAENAAFKKQVAELREENDDLRTQISNIKPA
jgi:chromosome segregation ATPase